MSGADRNIVWHSGGVERDARVERNGHRGAVVWLTGLSGSGKSTIAVELERRLFDQGCQTYILDGDNVRHGLNSDLGFTSSERDENIRRIGEVARLFVDSGMIVLAAFISPLRRQRERVRGLFAAGDFIEVFVDADIETCKERDPKGLYRKAMAGEIDCFTGISAPYEPPSNPEIALNTSRQSLDESVDRVLGYLCDTGVTAPDRCSS